MLYELRTYTSDAEHIKDLHRRFEGVTQQVFERHSIEVLGYFTDVEDPTTLVYLARFPDQQARDAAWEAFGADPEWQRAKAESEAEGKLVVNMQSRLLEPTGYSDLE